MGGRVQQLNGSTRTPLRLWDVLNTEAHVRATLDAWLDTNSAWLDPQQKLRALSFLWEECWKLSGLAKGGDPRLVDEDQAEAMYRWVWEVRGFYAPRTPNEKHEPLKLPQFNEQLAAELALEGLREGSRPVAFAQVVRARPNGGYDPGFGQSFSKYSRGILSLRVADWYRSDEEFGDTRYSNGERPESLEALADREHRRGDRADGSYIDRHSPGADVEFIDDLNRHAYTDPLEEVHLYAAVGR